jgi:hypothetical protein
MLRCRDFGAHIECAACGFVDMGRACSQSLETWRMRYSISISSPVVLMYSNASKVSVRRSEHETRARDHPILQPTQHASASLVWYRN